MTIVRRLGNLTLLGLATALLPGCSDVVEVVQPAEATAAGVISQNGATGSAVPEPPSVRVTGAGNRPVSGVRVVFSVISGGGHLTGAEQITDAAGIARVGSWVLGPESGPQAVLATIDGLRDARIIFEAVALPAGCATVVPLELGLGEFRRLTADSKTWPCLLFDADRSSDSEYLLLFENMPRTGPFEAALFPGATGESTFAVRLDVQPLAEGATPVTGDIRVDAVAHGLSADDGATIWDFGAGTIREHVPPPRPDTPPAGLVQAGAVLPLGGADAEPSVGDTIQVVMDAIPRLGIPSGPQKAVIRLVTDQLVIAEDIRLHELKRENGAYNSPIPTDQLEAIAHAYRDATRGQADLLFDGRNNTAVEAARGRRVTAVHSLTPSDDVWGYTWSVTDYFVWDYWVTTNGSTRGINQHPQRIADNLFMHEIAHMRHVGLLQRQGLGMADRGNRWAVEGFARFAERLPIAARLLGATAPPRTANLVLPRNAAFNNAYFMDDVPTYLHASSSFNAGYHASSWVFDYFADQVALRGGDWLAATRDLIVAAGSASRLDAVIAKWLPGSTFTDLVSQGRVALYADDIGTPGLPAWTQYHQFRLRESRPASTAAASQDPRQLWQRFSPSSPRTITADVPAGAAMGFVVDGRSSPSGIIRVSGPPGPHTLLSITRIR